MDNILLIAQGSTIYWLIFWVVIGLLIIGGGIAALMIKCLRKVPQGSAIIRNGMGGTKVSFDRDVVIATNLGEPRALASQKGDFRESIGRLADDAIRPIQSRA